jgi:Raf kinase inhibitor-like YbhB/YbcL family protein
MQIKTTAFSHEERIPEKHTCQGVNISPDLSWEAVPEKTKSFALIMEDPDAPVRPWAHWLVYNIPSEMRVFPAHFSAAERQPDGTLQGRNSLLKVGYDGPCPPRRHGPHHYFFRLYALDSLLPLNAGVEKEELKKAMEGHVLDQAELMGVFER